MARKKNYERNEVLPKLMMVFWQNGFEATSLSDLEQASGLDRRSLYNEFGDKEAVFDLAIQLYLEKAGELMMPVLTRKPMGLKNIKDFFLGMKYEPDSMGCLMTISINQKELIAKRTFEHIRKAMQQTEELFYQNLYAHFKKKEKAQRLAAFLTSNIQGITTMSKVDPDPKRLKRVVDTLFETLEA